MNNIINIRLGHYVLAADEDAANLLRNYSEALRNRYRNETGAEEIVQDIEERIGELLQMKQTETKRNFTTLEDAKEALDQLGPVESESKEGEGIPSAGMSGSNDYPRRRLFRDADSRILGGVCSGVGNYFNIDPVIIRLIWVVSVLIFGFGIAVYIILWVVIPEARTTAEKLMMRGQTPNLQNIEDNVKAEFRKVEENFTQNGGKDRASQFFRNLFQYAGKFILFVFKLVGTLIIGAILMALIAILITFTTKSFHIQTWHWGADGQAGLNALLSIFGDPLLLKVGVISFLLCAIAYIVLQAWVPAKTRIQLKVARRYLGWGIFILTGIFTFLTVQGLLSFSHHVEKEGNTRSFQLQGDTLFVQSEGELADDKGFYVFNQIQNIEVSNDSLFHIIQRNVAWGENRSVAGNKARSVQDLFRIEGNHIYFIEGVKKKSIENGNLIWANFTILVPKGKFVKTGGRFFNESDYPRWLESNQVYKIDSAGFAMPYSSSGKSIPYSGNATEIEVGGKFEVQVIQSNTEKIELVSGPVLRNRDWVSVHGNLIEIEGDEDDFFDRRTSVVRIYTRNLYRAEVHGISEIWFQNWKGNSLDLSCSGASHMRGKITSGSIKAYISGASEMHLQGNSGHLDLEVDGASTYSGTDFKVAQAEVDINGASHASLFVTDDLQGECGGAAQLYIKGKPGISRVDTHGAGHLQYID